MLYGASAVLGYALSRRPAARWPSRAAWAVVALCLTSGFAALLSPVHLLFFLSRNQPPVDWAALANQFLAVLGAVLWGCAALAHRRRALGTCPHCGGHGRTGDPRRTSVTADPARAGLVAAAALVPYASLETAWAGAGALAPFGAILAVVGVLIWAGLIRVDLADHAPWVFAVAYGGFSCYGLALARATRSYQRATRRTCAAC
ncbi:hypothetical protein ACWFR1_19890 [Streptomyces sp. NPDC055103]